jgi:hypothetical protein
VTALLSTLTLDGPQISGQRPWQWIGRDVDGWWRMVVFNDGAEDISFDILLGDGFDYTIWAAEHGSVEAFAAVHKLTVELEPHEIRCIRLRQNDQAAGPIGHLSSRPTLERNRLIALADGWTFAPDQDQAFVPISVDSGWEEQGFPAFSGTGIYRLSFTTETEADWMLELPTVHTAVTAYIDGTEVGRRGWRPYRLGLGHLAAGTHELELHVANTAANRYYDNTPYLGSGPDKSGLTATPLLIPLQNRPE